MVAAQALLLLLLLARATEATMPPGMYDACIADRKSNASLESPGGGGFAPWLDLTDSSQCIGRVPHPLDASYDAIGVVPCNGSSVVQLRYVDPIVASQPVVGAYKTLRFQVSQLRGPPPLVLGQTNEYVVGQFSFYYKGALVVPQSAIIYPGVQGIGCAAYPSYTIGSPTVANVSACAQKCMANGACVGYTVEYFPGSPGVPICNLRSFLGCKQVLNHTGGVYYKGFDASANMGYNCLTGTYITTVPVVPGLLGAAAAAATNYNPFTAAPYQGLSSSLNALATDGGAHVYFMNSAPAARSTNSVLNPAFYCAVPRIIVNVTAQLLNYGSSPLPVNNFYDSPIEFTFAQSVLIDSYTFTTWPNTSALPVPPTTQDPVKFDLTTSFDNGNTWQSVHHNAHPGFVPLARSATAGPFIINAAGLQSPTTSPTTVAPTGSLSPTSASPSSASTNAPTSAQPSASPSSSPTVPSTSSPSQSPVFNGAQLPAQVFSTGNTGRVMSSIPQSTPVAYTYYKLVPLGTQGADATTTQSILGDSSIFQEAETLNSLSSYFSVIADVIYDATTYSCSGIPYHFCAQLSEVEFFLQGQPVIPSGASFSLVDSRQAVFGSALQLIDGSNSTYITLALPQLEFNTQETAYSSTLNSSSAPVVNAQIFVQTSGYVVYGSGIHTHSNAAKLGPMPLYTAGAGGSIIFTFPEPTAVDSYRLGCGPIAAYTPVSWALLGSNDQVTWTELDRASEVVRLSLGQGFAVPSATGAPFFDLIPPQVMLAVKGLGFALGPNQNGFNVAGSTVYADFQFYLNQQWVQDTSGWFSCSPLVPIGSCIFYGPSAPGYIENYVSSPLPGGFYACKMQSTCSNAQGQYVAYNPTRPFVAGLTAMMPIIALPTPQDGNPWYTLELATGEIVLASFYRDFSQTLSTPVCSSNGVVLPAGASQGLVVFSIVNDTMLAQGIYGPDLGVGQPPSTVTPTASPTVNITGLVHCFVTQGNAGSSAVAVKPKIYLTTLGSNSAGTLLNVTGTTIPNKWAVTFEGTTLAARLTIVAGGPSISGSIVVTQCTSATCGFALQCSSSLAGWSLSTNPGTHWDVIPSNNATGIVFNSDATSLTPSNMGGSNSSAQHPLLVTTPATGSWVAATQSILPSVQVLWTTSSSNEYIGFTTPINQVLCQLNAAGSIVRVSVDGADVTSSVLGPPGNRSVDKWVTFQAPTSASCFTVIVAAPSFPSNNATAGFAAQCTVSGSPNSPWAAVNTNAQSSWRVVYGNNATFPADVCSLSPSNQSRAIIAGSVNATLNSGSGVNPIWSPLGNQYQAFTIAVASPVAVAIGGGGGSATNTPSAPSSIDFDQVYFSSLVRPVGALDPTSPTFYPTSTPSLNSNNYNVAPNRVLWFVGMDPLVGQYIQRSGRTCAGEGLPVSPGPVQTPLLEWTAGDLNNQVEPHFETGLDLSQATLVQTLLNGGAARLFGNSVCGCDTRYPMAISNTGPPGVANNIYCPAIDECPYGGPSQDPYGVGTATCGNGDYTYVTCLDKGPFVYGYTCECVAGGSYLTSTVRLYRLLSDVNMTTGEEINSCRPQPIFAFSSNYGVRLTQNVTFNTSMILSYYDSALISPKQPLDYTTQTNWSSVLIQPLDDVYYEPCDVYFGKGGSKQSDCLTKVLTGVIFRVQVVNNTDPTSGTAFYDETFTLPCGCTTTYLPVSYAGARPDDGRPKHFTAVQIYGQVLFTWIDDSYCASKFKFTRSLLANGAYGPQMSFVPNFEASGGASGTAKCQGDTGDLHAPVAAALSDRLLDFPETFPPGSLINYCVAATADETSNKPKYVSAQVCQVLNVNFEARFKVFVHRPDGLPAYDDQGGVTVTFIVFDPQANSSNYLSYELYRASNTTQLDGYIQIKLNLSTADYPTLEGIEKLNVGFFFSKTSYFADTGDTVPHTFLCNKGRSQCSPEYPNILVVPHLSFDEIVMDIEDNTYSKFSGYVGIGGLQQPGAFPVAPDFYNCPLANVQITFRENPGRSSDTSYGVAVTDSTGYYEIMLPIGSNTVISAMQLLNSQKQPVSRTHTFALATDGSSFNSTIYTIGAHPLAGVNFIDVTTEVLVVDVVGGACNVPIATDVYAVLTRNNEFCIPPPLPNDFSIATSGWPLRMQRVAPQAWQPGGPFTRYFAVIPATAFEVVTYVNATIDNNAGSAYGVNDFFFNHRFPQQSKPTIDFTSLAQNNVPNVTAYTTSPTSQPISLASLNGTYSPTASPFAFLAAYTSFTEAFEQARLLRFQYDGAVQVSVAFYQNNQRVDFDQGQTCSTSGAVLQGQNIAYVDVSTYGGQFPVVAVFTLTETFFASGQTCGYLPGTSLAIVNQIGEDSAGQCGPGGLPCSVCPGGSCTLQFNAAPNAVSAQYSVAFFAQPTNVFPYNNLFSFVYLGPQYPPAPYPNLGTQLQVFVLGQMDAHTAKSQKTILGGNTLPLGIIYQPPGDGSVGQFQGFTSTITHKEAAASYYNAFISDTDLVLETGEYDATCTGVVVTECLQQKASISLHYHLTSLNFTQKTMTNISEVHTQVSWSIASRNAQVTPTLFGADADVFAILLQTYVVVELDTISLGDYCAASLTKKFIVVPTPHIDRLSFITRWSLTNEIIPALQEVANAPDTSANTVSAINDALVNLNLVLTYVPDPPSQFAAATPGDMGLEPDVGRHMAFSGGGPLITITMAEDETHAYDTVSVAHQEYSNTAGFGFHVSFKFLVDFDLDGALDLANTFFNEQITDVATIVSRAEGDPVYILNDKDPSNMFELDVWIDAVYGSAYFSTVSGQSSCPHEGGTSWIELPGMFIAQSVATNIAPGAPAQYNVWIENLGNSDVNPLQNSTATFVLTSTMQQLTDGVSIYVDGTKLTSEGVTYRNIPQLSKFPITVQVFQGSLLNSYSLTLTVSTACGFDSVSVQLVSSFLSACPGIALVGEFATESLVRVLQGTSSVVQLVFQNLSPNYQMWSLQSNVASVQVEWSFQGINEWNLLVDPSGHPVDLREVESPATHFAVVQWDVKSLGLHVATFLVRGRVTCQVPPNANPYDTFLATSVTKTVGVIVLDVVSPYVTDFSPRSSISPGDVLKVTFNEPVLCAGPQFTVYLLQPPGPTVPAFGGLSTASENLVVECHSNTIAVQILPGSTSLLSMAGKTWYLLLLNVLDLAGNPVQTNIPLSSPFYLYQQVGNVEVALTYAPVDSSTRFSIVGLEVPFISNPAPHNIYSVGDANWNNVVRQIQSAVASNVGIDPSRIDVEYFWFPPGLATYAVVTCIVNPAAIPGEDLVAAFNQSYPDLFTSNGAQTMDLLPMSEDDKIKAQLDSLEARVQALVASNQLINGKLDTLLVALVKGYSASPTASQSPVTTRGPTPFPTQRPVPAPTNLPSKRPTTSRPTPRPTRLPTLKPTYAPTPPTLQPSQSPVRSHPSASPTRFPSQSPTVPGQTRKPSSQPTLLPTTSPLYDAPSSSPTNAPSPQPTSSPWNAPSLSPTTSVPSSSPSETQPTRSPSHAPTPPTTRSPTSKSPTSKSPTSQRPTSRPISSSPTTRSPTSKSPTSKAPVSG